jgi:hypothetical protein
VQNIVNSLVVSGEKMDLSSALWSEPAAICDLNGVMGSLTKRSRRPGLILPFNKGVSSSDEIGSILCTTDNERAIPKRRIKHRPKDSHQKRLTPTRTLPGFFYTAVQRGNADGWSETHFHRGKYEVAFTDAMMFRRNVCSRKRKVACRIVPDVWRPGLRAA